MVFVRILIMQCKLHSHGRNMRSSICLDSQTAQESESPARGRFVCSIDVDS